jgi:hypothetical protein
MKHARSPRFLGSSPNLGTSALTSWRRWMSRSPRWLHRPRRKRCSRQGELRLMTFVAIRELHPSSIMAFVVPCRQTAADPATGARDRRPVACPPSGRRHGRDARLPSSNSGGLRHQAFAASLSRKSYRNR